ncbi:hypothetical protein TWF730_010628 [Orbilia blumenaviensis]|uniref:Uncharacterized protein n=1 Tax=Orbilia blumenaviensis TaxID=1796055 RepID=A0AAV9UQ09_9PEZI
MSDLADFAPSLDLLLLLRINVSAARPFAVKLGYRDVGICGFDNPRLGVLIDRRGSSLRSVFPDLGLRLIAWIPRQVFRMKRFISEVEVMLDFRADEDSGGKEPRASGL